MYFRLASDLSPIKYISSGKCEYVESMQACLPCLICADMHTDATRPGALHLKG